MNTLIDNYPVLQVTLEEVAKGYDEYSRKASGLLSLMQNFSKMFGLQLSKQVFGATETLSNTLQHKQTTCRDAQAAVDICLAFLESIRTDAAFCAFFQKTKEDAEDVCDEPSIRRHYRLQYTNPETYFRAEYFQVLDLVMEDIKRRFHQDTFGFAREMEGVLMSKLPAGESRLPDLYESDLDFQTLERDLAMISSSLAQQQKTMDVDGIISTLNELPSIPLMFSNTDQLLRLYLTLPVTTRTAERSFSALRRVKTYMRTSMTQKLLNHCMLAHVHKAQTDSLDMKEIAKDFMQRNDVIASFFGSFE
ncbi:hypothetical protein ACOMHN_037439 [Nucella lapillus]